MRDGGHILVQERYRELFAITTIHGRERFHEDLTMVLPYWNNGGMDVAGPSIWRQDGFVHHSWINDLDKVGECGSCAGVINW